MPQLLLSNFNFQSTAVDKKGFQILDKKTTLIIFLLEKKEEKGAKVDNFLTIFTKFSLPSLMYSNQHP